MDNETYVKGGDLNSLMI